MPEKSKRIRKLPHHSLVGQNTVHSVNKQFGTDTTTVSQGTRFDMSGTQVTESEGHPFNSRKRGGVGDIGGEFFTQKKYVEGKSKKIKMTGVSGNLNSIGFSHTYEGPIYPTDPSTASGAMFPPASNSSNSALDALGATAIARCAPGNPPANAVTFLSELLKDGLPSLIGSQSWKHRASTAKAAGSEYLNLQFGWSPLVSDINSLANSIIKSDKILSQYERDAGKVVRRRYEFPTIRSIDETMIDGSKTAVTSPDSSLWHQSPTGQLIRRRETVVRRWFSGAFTYHLPVGYDSRQGLVSLAARARHLLGLDPTPDTLWEIAPWSWAVDWFSNTGDIIHNVSRFATGGLVMRYGYMMEHTIVKDTYTLDKSGLIYSGPINPISFVVETKIRRRANPFGFGLSWDGLSPFQLSILAALGMSRS